MEFTSPTTAAAAARGPIVRGAQALAALPAIDARMARLARLAADERLAAWLQLKLGITGFAVGAGDAVRIVEPGWIDLSHGFAHASIAIDLRRHPALASVAVDGDNRDAVTSSAGIDAADGARSGDIALRNAVAAILLTPFTDRLAALGLPDVRVLGIRRGREPADPRTALSVGFRLGERHIECRLGRLDDACVEAIAGCIGRQRIPFAQHASVINVPGRLVVGAKTYRIATLRTLRMGDVLLRALDPALAGTCAEPPQAADLRALWGMHGSVQLAATARLEGCTLTLKETPTMSYETEDHDAGTASGDEPIDIGELNLPVKFELDTVQMPVVQLSALRPGYVVELPVPIADARIRLTSYGQTIGTGELVTVGDQLGVRVLQMTHGNGSVQ
ncbi:type III secretion system cytoplasmic ring protein SctQ [Trinickia acidisoli]|uniref:type III secretion system cytoplasmic ring protein SctQ n=1 Tax=Trinickia acidisoli TaxID=2767482 RepID=UPI001A8CDD4E|nr:type III secretion system cytoplasmic ring protein SctQ [Trinickia acidisoli]